MLHPNVLIYWIEYTSHLYESEQAHGIMNFIDYCLSYLRTTELLLYWFVCNLVSGCELNKVYVTKLFVSWLLDDVFKKDFIIFSGIYNTKGSVKKNWNGFTKIKSIHFLIIHLWNKNKIKKLEVPKIQ